MVDPRDYKIAGAAAFFGFCAQQVMAVWLALPWAVQTVLQGLITIAIGACALVVQHFVRRFLSRRWPVEAAQNLALPQGEALVLARFDWFRLLRPVARPLFNLIRTAILRLRRRKET
jgi:hypothetical protein